MQETNWHRLWRVVEDRCKRFGITKSQLAVRGGPSAEWIRGLRDAEGKPSARRAAAMGKLDKGLGWPEGTAWHVLTRDRSGWSAEQLAEEEAELVNRAPAEAHDGGH